MSSADVVISRSLHLVSAGLDPAVHGAHSLMLRLVSKRLGHPDISMDCRIKPGND
jgi:hypothetical protein